MDVQQREAAQERNGAATRPGFWARLFRDRPSVLWSAFDAIFGLVLPVACVALDPGLFRPNVPEGLAGPFTQYAPGLYVLTLVGSASFGLAMLRRPPSPILAGVLISAAVLSTTVGLVLLPFSLIGLLLYGIGALGLVPFLTALAYWRQATFVWRAAAERDERGGRDGRDSGRATDLAAPSLDRETSPQAREDDSRVADDGLSLEHRRRLTRGAVGVALLVLLLVGVQVGAHLMGRHDLNAIIEGEPRAAQAAMERLTWTKHFTDLDRLVRAYDDTHDPRRKARIAQAYQRLTGTPIESRLSLLKD